MNRAERRKLKREEKEKTFTMKGSDIEEIKKQVMKKTSKFAFDYIVSIPLIVLRDEFGFGQKRCERFCEAAAELLESINSGHLSLEDIRETIEKELNMELIRGKME